ncbi:hypothetical protein D3C72_320710 [compost metagenome]
MTARIPGRPASAIGRSYAVRIILGVGRDMSRSWADSGTVPGGSAAAAFNIAAKSDGLLRVDFH